MISAFTTLRQDRPQQLRVKRRYLIQQDKEYNNAGHEPDDPAGYKAFAARPDVKSGSGQSRKLARLNGMSVLPSTADVVGPPRHVRFVPTRDSCTAANGSFYSITSCCVAAMTPKAQSRRF